MDESNFTDRFLKTYRAGEAIFLEGSVGQQMYVVASGSVDIVRGKGDGEGARLATLHRGDIFGEMALLDHLPRSASAVAATDARVLEIDHALFVYLVTQQPAFALLVQKSLSLRLRGIAASQDAPPRDEGGAPERGKAPEPVEIGENVHLLRGKCNCYLFRGTRKNVLVDTGLPWEKDVLAAQLAALGLAPDDVHMVVLTHEHLDHIGGVPLFPRRTVVAAHNLAANKIGLQDEFVLMSKAYHLDVSEYHVDVHLHHGTMIDLGGCELHVLHSPGHSSGSICLYEPDRELLLTGDTIFANGILGGIFPSGALSDYALTLRQLSALRVREIFAGHGKRSTTPVEDFEKAIRGSLHLMNDTRSLFAAFDSREEFAEVSKAVSTYAKRV